MLSSEVPALNGVSLEGTGISLECLGAVIVGFTVALVYCWQIALSIIAIFPILSIGAYLD
jgi:hypothetical protein